MGLRRSVAPLALGFFVGWLFTRFVWDAALVPGGNILEAATTLAVGWWVQSALRRRAQLDRVPINAITKLSERIGSLIDECLHSGPTAAPTDGQLLSRLRVISIEITWLGRLAHALGAGKSEQELLYVNYLSFKEALTGGSTIDLGQAGKFGMQMRTRCLQIQLLISQRILDDPECVLGISAMGPAS